jgi:rfaE bifunctional protein nucleotidyltransferase chain/domain
MHPTHTKIRSTEALLERLSHWRSKGERIVFTNGCFDLLHPGHIDNLEAAKGLGDRLVVGLNSDASVSRLKGPSRPIQPEAVRARMLAALAAVDAVSLFTDDTPRALIQTVKPDILVKGGDYLPHEVVGHDIVSQYGGAVHIVPLTTGYSTTSLIERIKETMHTF